MKGTVFFRPSKSASNAARAKKVGTWTYQFAVKTGDDRRFISKGGFATKKAAQDAMTMAMAPYVEDATYKPFEPSQMTLAAFLRDEWLPVLTALKPTTVASYKGMVDAYISAPGRIGDERLCDLTPGKIATFYQDIRANGRKRAKGALAGTPLGDATVHKCHVVLGAALAHAVETGLLRINPVAQLPRNHRPRQTTHDRPEMRVWSAEQAATFLDAVAGDRLGPLYDLALNTGMRRGELVGLRWSDIDLDAGVVSVRRNRVIVDGAVADVTPKSKKARTVDLDPSTVKMLRSHRAAQLQERLAWGEAWTDSGYVFTREDGTPLHPDTASSRFETLVTAAGVPPIRFHDLRHTHATLGLAAGVPVKVMSERLGHAKVQITIDLYQHVIPGMGADAAAKIAGLLRRAQ